jgi:preprotein translocase subunit SecA
MEDDVMRLFGSERMISMMDALKIDEDTPIDAKILSGAIENAQRNVESRNFQMRKNVLEYDDVMNTQRKVIYDQRRQVLEGEDLSRTIEGMLRYVVSTRVAESYGHMDYLADRDQLNDILRQFEGVYIPVGTVQISDNELAGLRADELEEKLMDAMHAVYAAKEAKLGAPLMREVERVILLGVVDEYWMDNIDAMTDLRQGIGLRAYGQHDPVDTYKREGYEMFEGMTNAIREETIRRLYAFQPRTDEEVKRKKVATITGESAGGDKTVKKQPVRKQAKVGPNDPCPCGSGKKYKKCCRDKDLANLRGQ